MNRSLSVFGLGSLAGLGALAFNFLFRIGGFVPFPPESALGALLRVIPAGIEEPMVQSFGDLAGQLGLLIATLIAAAVYGVLTAVFDRYAAKRVAAAGLGRLEVLLILSLVPWLIFGLALFPLDGDAIFGVASPYAGSDAVWAFPLGFLLVQGIFAWVLSLRYRLPADAVSQPPPARWDVRRREFIEKGAIGGLAFIGAALGLLNIGTLFPSEPSLTGAGAPIDLQGAPAIFSDPRLAAFDGSEVTANSAFYRVAIDVIDPAVDGSSWSLAVDGLVNSPKTYSLPDIQSFPEVDQYSTFECVSNNVNGNLIGNAKWGGVKISDVLAAAGGVQQGAQYVVFYSVDGYSVGIPLARAMKSDSLLAYSMNDEPLPTRHGFPLRGVIPGLYGMMSAKWVTRVSVIGSVYDGYWQTRGWTNNADVYTGTFFVLPSGTASLSKSGGSIIIAGYAYAGDRGISKVEVSVDNGATWEAAQLKPPLSNLAWALWAYEWMPASAGEYDVIARATDGAGALQTSAKAGTFPNGATGYAAATLIVTD